MQRAHLEEEPGVLLYLVRCPVAVRSGAVQGAEELERHQDAVEHQADGPCGGEDVQVPRISFIEFPARQIRQRVQGVGAVRLLRAVEHLGAALHQRPDGDGVECNAGVDAVKRAVLGRAAALGALRHGEEHAERQEAQVLQTHQSSSVGPKDFGGGCAPSRGT